ncbi:MAG: hypothetical protein ACMUHX_00360 [bacterium]
MSYLREKRFRIFAKFFPILIFFLFYIPNSLIAETYLWQDFEYWDSPRNHGWISSTPSYPVWGAFPYIGFGNLKTTIDPRLQSRVLVFDSMTSPLNKFYRFRAVNQLIPDPDPDTSGFDKNIVSFNIQNFLGIEQFDQWEVQFQLISRNGKNLLLVYRPLGIQESGPEVGGIAEYAFTNEIQGGDPDNPGNPLVVIYNLGRQYQDGGWHMVVRDLDQDIREIGIWNGIDFELDGFGREFVYGPENSSVEYIMIIGSTVMVDNIAFHDRMQDIINHPLKLQRIGPQYAQIFVPYSILISVYDRSDLDITSSDGMYDFFATIGGYGYQGIQTSDMIFRVKEDPNNPGRYLKCSINDPACIVNKAILEFIPHTFEDLIITVRVTDPGGLSDIETFPLSVVNYPIVNHPPYLEEIENDVYLIGSNEGYFEKEFICYDQDEEDYPGTTTESGNITYKAFIDSQPNYHYGPWQYSLIPDPHKPVIRFSPRFEGTHQITVIATDQRGLSAVTGFTLVVVNYGTWMNHPPVLCEDIDSPQVVRAGSMVTIPIEFFDPDQEPIYYYCNIGSITEIKEGFGNTPDSSIGLTNDTDKYGRYVSGAIYSFTSHFPGTYLIQITAYDIRGGYSIAEFVLNVQPWWSI